MFWTMTRDGRAETLCESCALWAINTAVFVTRAAPMPYETVSDAITSIDAMGAVVGLPGLGDSVTASKYGECAHCHEWVVA